MMCYVKKKLEAPQKMGALSGRTGGTPSGPGLVNATGSLSRILFVSMLKR